jgi:AraC-like DNA-binding protein
MAGAPGSTATPASDLEFSLPTTAGIATYPPGATFGPRRMTDFEFVWMIQGDAQYRRGSALVDAPQGSVVLCRPGAIDAFRWDTARRTRHGFFHFQIQALPEGWPALQNWPLVRTPEEGDLLPPLFRYLLSREKPGDSRARHLALELLLETFIHGASGAAPVPPETLPEAVERATNFLYARLESEPSTPIALGELARAACVTPEHLCRVFKQAAGRSPLETVRLARLDRAATLLARTNYSIGEIAAMCGFASAFHFSRKFREAFGLAPRDLRQKIRNGSTPPTPLLLQKRGEL